MSSPQRRVPHKMGHISGRGPSWREAWQRAVDAENARDRYREALIRYGRHLHDCDLTRRGAVNGGACDCGWRDVQIEVESA